MPGTGDLLHRFGQRGDLLAVTLAGSGPLERRQVAQRTHHDVDLAALRRLAPS